MTSTKPLRLAIIGGGLAGATLINALMTLPHLSIKIYESAPQFSERGAAVGLSVNAQRALSEIGPGVREALDRAGAVRMNSMRSVIVRMINMRVAF
jgi:salicylate hydroxylase